MTLARVRRGAWAPVGLVVAGMALLLPKGRIGALAGPAAALSGTTRLPGTPAPGFTLTDQNGQVRSLAGFGGRVVVLAFIDSRCTDVCPLVAQSLQEMQDALGRRAADVQLLAVDANPDATAVADAAQWTREHGMSGRWLFLTGPVAELQGIWAAYHVGVEVESDGQVVHTDAVYVIDRQGRERRLLIAGQGGGVAGDARALQGAVTALL